MASTWSERQGVPQFIAAVQAIRGILYQDIPPPISPNGGDPYGIYRAYVTMLEVARREEGSEWAKSWAFIKTNDPFFAEAVEAVQQEPLTWLLSRKPELTDLGNSSRFTRLHREDVRYSNPWGTWLEWDGKHWKKDEPGTVLERGKTSALGIYTEIDGTMTPEEQKAYANWARRSQSKKGIQDMLFLSQSDPAIAILPDVFDRDPWLLNVLNGTVDLRSGELRPHRREDYLTKLVRVPYLHDAECPRWTLFLQEIFQGDVELVTFFQKAVGYSLTGDTRERCLFLCHGPGANGKSTALEVIGELLGEGEYALRTAVDMLLEQRNNNTAPYYLARLRGIRFAHASETGQGAHLAEGLVKDLTGGIDTVVARDPYGRPFTFRPSFKLWLRTNWEPIIRGTDQAIWDRIRKIPFLARFETSAEPDLRETLMAELPGILTWAVFGCLLWQTNGLKSPAAVLQATATYRQDMDPLPAFLSDACEQSPSARVTNGDLWAAYQFWARQNTDFPILGRKQFSQALDRAGFDQETGGARRWLGLKLINDVSNYRK